MCDQKVTTLMESDKRNSTENLLWIQIKLYFSLDLDQS